MLKQEHHPQHDIIRKMKSFDEYIDWRVHKDLRFQHSFFYDNEGKNLMNYIGKLETIDIDFSFLKNKLKLNNVNL